MGGGDGGGDSHLHLRRSLDGTPARKLVMDFMSKQEARETIADAKREQDGESIESFSWDAAKDALYQELKAARRTKT